MRHSVKNKNIPVNATTSQSSSTFNKNDQFQYSNATKLPNQTVNKISLPPYFSVFGVIIIRVGQTSENEFRPPLCFGLARSFTQKPLFFSINNLDFRETNKYACECLTFGRVGTSCDASSLRSERCVELTCGPDGEMDTALPSGGKDSGFKSQFGRSMSYFCFFFATQRLCPLPIAECFVWVSTYRPQAALVLGCVVVRTRHPHPC